MEVIPLRIKARQLILPRALVMIARIDIYEVTKDQETIFTILGSCSVESVIRKRLAQPWPEN